MELEIILGIILGVAALAAIVVLVAAYVCFRLTFYAKRDEKEKDPDKIEIPDGDIYEAFRPQIEDWTRRMRALPQKDVEITSFDGLKLRGKYFELEPGAPIELLMHGYRGDCERDLCGGVFRCFALGRNALLVDHRASGRSEGNVITFGINESRDCVDWVNYIIENIDPNAKIFIGGVSMGGATTQLACARGLPKNVVGLLSDCGYSSAKRIIKKVIAEMHLPPDLCYPFVRLGGKIYGHFDLEEISPEDAMKNCTLPIIFFHGDADGFVPAKMSVESYNACASKHKHIVMIEGADHGLAFPAAQERYVKQIADFFEKAFAENK